jgi:hypothetical protein
MKQIKYEVILTMQPHSKDTQEEMLNYIRLALEQEMGWYLEDLQIKQVGFLLKDD